MPVGYHHLTHAERCQIHALLYRGGGGGSKREIARDLGRDPATISRETSRHRGQRGDRHQQLTARLRPVARQRRRCPGRGHPSAGQRSRTGCGQAGARNRSPVGTGSRAR